MKKKTRAKRPTRSRGKPESRKKARTAASRAKPLRILDARPREGRPSPYVAEYAHIAEVMCAGGATDYELAKAFGISVRTLYRWKAEHAEFCQAIKGAKGVPIERVERSLYHRATGYTFDAQKVVVVGKQVVAVDYTEHVPPDTAAARLWLMNSDPLRWRDRHDVTARVGELKPEEDLTDEELLVIVQREQRKREARGLGEHLNSEDCWCREQASSAANPWCKGPDDR